MLRMRRIAFVTTLLVLALGPSRVDAKPSSSTLADIDAAATTVAIVTFAGPTTPNAPAYDLTVDRVIRGVGAPGSKLHVKAAPWGHAHMNPGDRVVAFVDASGTWLAFANNVVGPSLENGVLHLEGFDDFDAHLVTPGFVTLAQLEGLVARHVPLAWTFHGKLLLPTASGLAPSSIEISAQAPSNVVTGMPPTAGFPSPTVAVGTWPDTLVTVDWSRNLSRPLALRGVPVGKNADGSIEVTFRLEYPELLSEADLRKYVADPKLGHPYHVLALDAGTRHDAVVLSRDIGRIGTLDDGTEIVEAQLAPDRFLRGLGVKVSLPPTSYRPQSGGFVDALLEELFLGPIACARIANGASVPCRLRYVETRFATP